MTGYNGLIDTKGNPISSGMSVQKSVPNLDSRFFQTETSTEISAENILNAPYVNHVWTYACARTISWNVGRLKHVLKEKESQSVITDHPIYSIWENPHPLLDQVSFWQTVILLLLLSVDRQGKLRGSHTLGGQCFIVPWGKNGKVNLRKGELPIDLLPLSDSFFDPIYGLSENTGMHTVIGWKMKYDTKDKPVTIKFTNEELIRIRLVNPYDILKGMSPQTAAGIAVFQDAQSDVYNTKLFENDARVAGVLTTEQNLSQDVADDLTRRWYTKYGGAGNSSKIALMSNGLKYQQIGLTQSDMQYAEQKQHNLEQITAAFGLNKIALGMYENINRATLVEGRKMLWQDTYLPIDEIIWSALNNQWIKWVDEGKYYGCSDVSKVEPLQPNHKQLSEAMGKYVKDCDLPPVIAARLVGVELTEDEIKEYPYLSEPPRLNSQAEMDNDNDSEDSKKSKTGGKVDSFSYHTQNTFSPVPLKSIIDFETPLCRLHEITINNDENDLKWVRFIEKSAEPGEANFKRKLKRFLISQRNRMQDKVDEWYQNQKALTIVNPLIFTLDSQEEYELLINIYGQSVAEQVRFDAQVLEDELGELIQWGVKDPDIQRYIKERSEYVKGINTTTFKKAGEKISQVIDESMNENLTVAQTAKKIKDSIWDTYQIRTNQALTIARTEMLSVSSMTRFDAFRSEGIDKQQWVTSMDERVRTGEHSHRSLNGKQVNIGEYFKRNGSSTNMKFPRDNSGAIGDIINCRCVAVAILED